MSWPGSTAAAMHASERLRRESGSGPAPSPQPSREPPSAEVGTSALAWRLRRMGAREDPEAAQIEISCQVHYPNLSCWIFIHFKMLIITVLSSFFLKQNTYQ